MEQNEELDFLPSNFQFHNFHFEVGEVIIQCQIMKMEKSLYLWIGDCNEKTMTDLALALAMENENKTSILATKIMGSIIDEVSTNIASRLSKRLGQPVYVSFNINVNNRDLPNIERRIHEEFKSHPEISAL
jgi:hypothetical protein